MRHEFVQLIAGDFECRKCGGWDTSHMSAQHANEANTGKCPETIECVSYATRNREERREKAR